MHTLRLLAALGILLPTLAQAQTYYYPVSTPTSGVSRASFVQMTMGYVDNLQGGTNCFTDVKTQSYAPSVCAAKAQGIVTGDVNGTFRPDASITFIEAAAVALRAKGASVGSDVIWYRPYLKALSDRNAFPSSVSNILNPMSVTQAQELLTNVFSAEHSFTNNSHTPTSTNSSSNDGNKNDDVQLTVIASSSSVDVGDTVTYTMKVRNNDNRDLNNLKVYAFIDSDFDFVSTSDDGNYDKDRIDWEIDVDKDETETITLKLRVSGSAEEGDKLSFRVKADDSEIRKTLTIDEEHNNDDLKISISDSPSSVEPGDTVTYTIRLENEDDNDLRVDVRALLDDDMEFVSASDDGDENDDEIEWDNIFVGENDDETLTLKVRISNSANDGDTVRLEVRSEGQEDTETTKVDEDNMSSNNNDDIAVSISDSQDPAERGEIVMYTIRLKNNTNNDQEVDVVATLDPGMTIYTNSDGSERNGREIRWRDLLIQDDDDRVVNLKVRINSYVHNGDTVRLKVHVGTFNVDEVETTRVEY